jgi:two-component system phosphate regulon sensor histidine kinase PhoR
MLSFRQKVIASYATLYVLFLAIMFLVVRYSVGAVVKRAMGEQAAELISAVEETGSINQGIQLLKGRERTYFFRVGLLDSQGRILYDSKARKLFGPAFNPTFETNHPEVQEALQKGVGYSEDYSTLFSQKFAYLAQSFELRGKTYVLRLAFPFRPIEGMTRDFEIGFTALVSLVLLSFALLNGLVINRLMRPVELIVQKIGPYQRGETDRLPQLPLTEDSPSTEFDRLSDTLNRLNERVQGQIETLRIERNERNALLESLSEGIMAFDEHGQVGYLNPAAKRLLGLKGPIDLPVGAAALPCSQGALMQMAASMVDQVGPNADYLSQVWERREGPLQVIQIQAGRLKGRGGILVVLQDVTSAAQVLRIGKDFVANASHELRTPITIIRGFAETLHEHPNLDRDARTEMTAKIVRNCSRMEVLIQNLLLLADIEHLPKEHQYLFDLQNVAEDCVESARELRPQDEIDLAVDGQGPFIIRGSSDLIELAVMNLLNNAAKYSQGIAQIAVKLIGLPHEVIVEVQDRGIGIPAADLPNIFNRFFTVDKARSRKLGGAGLGLAIVKSIVEKHGGSVSVSSKLGEGTTFRLQFPKA